MFIDALGLLSDSQAFTVDAASTNTIDLGDVTPKRDIGSGEPLCLAIAAETASTGGGSYEFRLIGSPNADLSSPVVYAAIFMADFATTSGLPIGSLHYLPIPPNIIKHRYIGAYFNNVSGTTSVTVSIALQPMSMIRAGAIYANGYTIS